MDLLLRVPNNLYLSGLMQTRYAPVKSAKLCKFRPTKDVSPGIVNEGESCPIFLWAIHPSVCTHFSANLSSELLELSSDRAITAHTIITHWLFFFSFSYKVEEKDEDVDLTKKWFYNEHLQTAAFQTEEWEIDSSLLYCWHQTLGYDMLCSYTTNLPWSICSWQLWIYRMRNWTVNKALSNKNPFSFLIRLGAALWLCSCSNPSAQVKGCANGLRLPEEFLIPGALVYPAWLLIAAPGLL